MTSFTRHEFHGLFVSERDKLFRMLTRLTGNAQDAEDLLQETFLTAWRKRATFEGRGAPEGFLRTTALRQYLNWHARGARRPQEHSTELVASEPPVPQLGAEPLERDEARDFLVGRVRAELERLPREAREVFLLFRFEGLSCPEIAEALGAPLKTVQTRLRRATLALAERLEPLREHFLAP
ncbi:MAG: RNA polymerase sigma factor [Planctomycetes bacterium]|nr:RNA polymerase sigma factor [Planctomycetota bacterium]